MTYRNEVRYTSERTYDGSQATRYMSNFASPSHGNRHSPSRSTKTHGHLPKRKRWAAGYIDRQSCPSNGYINTHHYAPDDEYPSDTEYIAKPRSRSDEYIQTRSHRDRHAPSHVDRRHSIRCSHIPESSTEQRNRSKSFSSTEDDIPSGSDIERLPTHTPPPRYTTSHTKLHRPIATPNSRRPSVSDIASPAPSPSPSDCHPLSSSPPGSDMQRLHRRRSTIRSASPSESGYISLDEYIAGRSDVVSIREGEESEGGGEGSDAVGSEDGSESGMGEGSDVEVLSEWGEEGGGDLIEEGWGGEYIEEEPERRRGGYQYDGC